MGTSESPEMFFSKPRFDSWRSMGTSRSEFPSNIADSTQNESEKFMKKKNSESSWRYSWNSQELCRRFPRATSHHRPDTLGTSPRNKTATANGTGRLLVSNSKLLPTCEQTPFIVRELLMKIVGLWRNPLCELLRASVLVWLLGD